MWGFLFLELLAKGVGVDMTDKRLAEIEARHKHAKESHIIFVGRDLFPEDPTQQALADFINFQSHALDDVPWLISEVRRWQEIADNLTQKIEKLRADAGPCGLEEW